jgi:hypothetical protein
MTILLTLTLWSFTAALPPLDAAEGAWGFVADCDPGPGSPLLMAPFKDEDCPAVLEKSGGTPVAGPLAGTVRRARASSRLTASLPGFTSQRSPLRIRLRC